MVQIKRTTGNYNIYGKINASTLIAPIQAFIDGDNSGTAENPRSINFGTLDAPDFPPQPGNNIVPYLKINYNSTGIDISAFEDISSLFATGLSNGDAIEIIGPAFNIDGLLLQLAGTENVLAKGLLFRGFLVDAYVGSFNSQIGNTQLLGSRVIRKSDRKLIGMFFNSTQDASGIQHGFIYPADQIN